jgi:putative ABC transport system permease protein
MSTLRRGARNVFRNPIRTIAVVAILGISLGMIVVMMTARRAVEQRITEVKANIGNTITISPAGARGFLGGGEALTTAQLTAVSAISHVTRVDAIIDAQLGSSDTNLQSGITWWARISSVPNFWRINNGIITTASEFYSANFCCRNK